MKKGMEILCVCAMNDVELSEKEINDILAIGSAIVSENTKENKQSDVERKMTTEIEENMIKDITSFLEMMDYIEEVLNPQSTLEALELFESPFLIRRN